MRRLILVGLVLIPAPVTAQPPAKYADAIKRLDALIERERQENGIPGLSVAVVEDQTVIWAKGFGHADLAKMGCSLIFAQIADKEFTAPDGAIGAETGAIQAHADNGIGKAVLRHTARQMRMMVLYAEQFDVHFFREFAGVAGGDIIRM